MKKLRHHTQVDPLPQPERIVTLISFTNQTKRKQVDVP
jgi:hypothetical protein